MVSRLRLRGMSQREIQRALPAQSTNPENQQPWSLATINGDVKALHRQWREDALQATDEHKARTLAELAEVKRAGWGAKDMNIVLKAIQQERSILGLDAPVRTDITTDGESLNVRVILRANDDSRTADAAPGTVPGGQ
jgi:DNA-binding transcriptional MerR regulator